MKHLIPMEFFIIIFFTVFFIFVSYAVVQLYVFFLALSRSIDVVPETIRTKNWNAGYCLFGLFLSWFESYSGYFGVAHRIVAFHILQTTYSLIRSYAHIYIRTNTHTHTHVRTLTLARIAILFGLEWLSHCRSICDVLFYYLSHSHIIEMEPRNFSFYYCCFCCCCFFSSSLNSFTLIGTHTWKLFYMCVFTNVQIVLRFHYETQNSVEKKNPVHIGFYLNSVQ